MSAAKDAFSSLPDFLPDPLPNALPDSLPDSLPYPLPDSSSEVGPAEQGQSLRASKRHSRKSQSAAKDFVDFVEPGQGSATNPAVDFGGASGFAVFRERMRASLDRIHSDHADIRVLLDDLRSRVADIECATGRVNAAFARMAELGAVVQGQVPGRMEPAHHASTHSSNHSFIHSPNHTSNHTSNHTFNHASNHPTNHPPNHPPNHSPLPPQNIAFTFARGRGKGRFHKKFDRDGRGSVPGFRGH